MKEIKGITDTEALVVQRYQYFDKTENFDLSELFLKYGRFLPKPEGFDLSNTMQKFLETLNTDAKIKATVEDFENQLARVLIPRKSMGGLRTKTEQFFVGESDNYIFYIAKSDAAGFSVFGKPKPSNVTLAFENQLRKEQEIINPDIYKFPDNVLTRSLSDFELLSVFSLCEKDELILAALPVNKLKFNEPETDLNPKRFCLLISEHDTALVGFNSNSTAVYYKKLSNTDLKAEGFWETNYVADDNLSMQPASKSKKYFKPARKLLGADIETRLKEVISINYEAGAMVTANNMMRLMRKKTGDSFYDFSRMFIDFIKANATFVNEEHRDILFAEAAKVLSKPVSGEKYQFVLMRSGITHDERAVFLNLLLHAGSTQESFANGLPAAEFIYKDFIKKCKDKGKKLLISMLYAKFLIKAEQNEQADKLIKKIQKVLPEEELTLLMPDKATDLLSPEGGKYLLSELYELMLKRREDKTDEYLHYLAETQPLNIERLQALAEKETIFSARAKDLLALLNNETREEAPANIDFSKLKPLKATARNKKLKHPAERSNGSMRYIKKWLANNKNTDFTFVKSYTELFRTEDKPELMEKLRRMATLMGVPKTEWYLAHGDMANELLAYPGEPPFIIIGKTLVEQNHDVIIVLAARQLAHILHGHAKITAKSIWQNFTRDGQINLDRFANSVSTAGLKGKSIADIEQVTLLTEALHRSVDLNQNNINKTEALNTLYAFLKSKYKKNTHSKDSKRLILAGRLLSVSADRAGLLFSPDIQTAIKALTYFYTQKDIFTDENINIKELIYAKNNDGSHKYPELLIRVINLASFYLSDDYAYLCKKMRK